MCLKGWAKTNGLVAGDVLYGILLMICFNSFNFKIIIEIAYSKFLRLGIKVPMFIDISGWHLSIKHNFYDSMGPICYISEIEYCV